MRRAGEEDARYHRATEPPTVMVTDALSARGWVRIPAHSDTLAWARAAHRTGLEVTQDPEMQRQWLHCEGTWFVGVDALPNAPDGSLGAVPLKGPAIDLLRPLPPLHRAQLSVTYPGYPRPRAGEGAGAFRYRLNRDAAHVDGIIAEGPDRRRFVREPHAFILGLPLTAADSGASPLVVWEGSPEVMRAALLTALDGHPAERWADVDVTEAYQAARREVFARCPRVVVTAQPGEAILLHRLALHGVAPWQPGAVAPPEGRMIAYFRPPHERGVAAWLVED